MKKIILYLTFILTTGCTFHNVNINTKADDSAGKVVLNNFYHQISIKNFDEIENSISDSLKASTGPDGIKKMLVFIHNKAGDFKTYSIQDRYVKSVTGSTSETSYNYKLKVTYEKGTIEEIVGFQKIGNAEIKLFSYHVNSDLLMR